MQSTFIFTIFCLTFFRVMLGINLEDNTYCAIKIMKRNEVNSI